MRFHHVVLGLILGLSLTNCNQAGFSGGNKGKTLSDANGGGDGSGSNTEINTDNQNSSNGAGGPGGGDGSGGPGGGDGSGGGGSGGPGGGDGSGGGMCKLADVDVKGSLAKAVPATVDCYGAGNLYYFDGKRCVEGFEKFAGGCTFESLKKEFAGYSHFMDMINAAEAENAKILACGNRDGFHVVEWARPPQDNTADCGHKISWFIQTICGGIEANAPVEPDYCKK